MNAFYLPLAVATVVLLGGGQAFAQSSNDAKQPQQQSADAPSSTPSATGSAADVSTTTNVRVVTNGPIPDTPENRARFGKPLSNAGRNSKPAGN